MHFVEPEGSGRKKGLAHGIMQVGYKSVHN